MATLNLHGRRLLRRLLSYCCSILSIACACILPRSYIASRMFHCSLHTYIAFPYYRIVTYYWSITHSIGQGRQEKRRSTPLWSAVHSNLRFWRRRTHPLVLCLWKPKSLILLPWYSSGVRGTPLCNSVNLRPQWRTNVRTHTDH